MVFKGVIEKYKFINISKQDPSGTAFKVISLNFSGLISDIAGAVTGLAKDWDIKIPYEDIRHNKSIKREQETRPSIRQRIITVRHNKGKRE